MGGGGDNTRDFLGGDSRKLVYLAKDIALIKQSIMNPIHVLQTLVQASDGV